MTASETDKDLLFDSSQTFAQLGLSAPIQQALDHMGFEHPTLVQSRLIPMALTGKDLLGQSKTGTGKTAAFGIPMIQMLEEAGPFSGLILVPTRELAIQVGHELRNLARMTKLRLAAVYGGQRMRIQIDKLHKGPQIIVGTPGRIMDMHQRGHLPYDKVRMAVLDEVDRMLDIGFRDDIRRILGTMKQKHQTIFVSATISPEIDRLGRQYMNDAVRLDVTEGQSLTVAQVSQSWFSVEPWDKKRLLQHLLKHEEPAVTLVFCRTKQTVDGLTRYLNRKNVNAHAIHGDMYQGRRNRVMEKFRGGELHVLVASDLAARGLDVTTITHVINYDLPEDPEVYVHRIGRTARAGRDGIAWSFVTPEQGALLSAIERLTNVEIAPAEYDDFEPGPVPADIVASREKAAEREEATRLEYSRVPVVPPAAKDEDAARFPGGKVPVALPSKRMGGRLRLRRR